MRLSHALPRTPRIRHSDSADRAIIRNLFPKLLFIQIPVAIDTGGRNGDFPALAIRRITRERLVPHVPVASSSFGQTIQLILQVARLVRQPLHSGGGRFTVAETVSGRYPG